MSRLVHPTAYSTADLSGMQIVNPTYAYDNDTSTYAQFKVSTGTVYGSGSFILDFGASRTITTLYYKTQCEGGDGATSYYAEIYGSTDGSTWTKLADVNCEKFDSSDLGDVEVTLDLNATYRYLKFYVYNVVYLWVYELYGTLKKVSSGKRVQLDANTGIIYAAENELISPYRFYDGDIKSFYLESPDEDDASGKRIKGSATSSFVEEILGSGSDGIMAVAIWSYFMSTTLKLTDYSFGTTYNYAVFGDADDNNLFCIEWGHYDYGSYATSFTTTITLPKPFASADQYSVLVTAGRTDGVATVGHGGYDSKTATSFLAIAEIDSSDNNHQSSVLSWVAFGVPA